MNLKPLYFKRFDRLSFTILVGDVHSYFDRDIKWNRVSLSLVRFLNRQRMPRLWHKPFKSNSL